MDNLIVLGNGFDIDLGLKTSFKKFVESQEFLLTPNIPLIKKIKERTVENWYDLEGLLRQELIAYSQSPSTEYAEDINNAWFIITKTWGIYLPRITDLDKITINKNSCAYHLLSIDQAHDSSWYTFNYTNPWYLCKMHSQKKAIYVHNENTPLDWSKHNGLMQLIPANLIIGVDSMVPSCINLNQNLSHLIKNNSPHFQKGMKNNIIERLYTTDNVVLFGQSLGITDSDYFKPYFNGIIEGKIRRQNIFIVTYNEESFSNICTNMQEYGINFEEINKADVHMHLVYTIKGTESAEFTHMLTTLYGVI